MSEYVLPGIDPESQVELPTGSEFAPTGLVGPWVAEVLKAFNSEADLFIHNKESPESEQLPYYRRRRRSNDYRYYFRDSKMASRASEVLEAFSPESAWCFEVPMPQVINFRGNDEARARWGEAASVECVVKTLRSKLHRHEFHHIALPSSVAATAKFFGFEVPDYDLSELLDQNAVFTDEFQAAMTGSPDEQDSWLTSVLGQRRKELWAALGEDDPAKYTYQKGSKTDTESEKLGTCLQMAIRSWTTPIWCRIVLVPNPRVSAVSSAGNRLTLPALTEIFPNEAAARAAVAGEGIEAEASTSPAPVKPPLPSQWALAGETVFVEWLKGQKDVAATAIIAEGGATDVSEVQTWRRYLQAMGQEV